MFVRATAAFIEIKETLSKGDVVRKRALVLRTGRAFPLFFFLCLH